MDPFSYLSNDEKHIAITIKNYLEDIDPEFEAKKYVNCGTNEVKFENGSGEGSISLIYQPDEGKVIPRKRKRYMSHTTTVSGEEVEVMYSGALEKEDVEQMLENAENAERSSNADYEVKTSGNT